MSRRTLITLAAVSLLSLVLSVVVIARSSGGGPRDAGRVPVAVPTTEASRATTPTIGVQSGRLEDLPRAASPPVRVRVDEPAIDAPVVAIGVDPGTSALEIPDDVTVAGWYRFGPTPGGPGSAVITAHVDSAAQGAGAFFRLRSTEPGAIVTVTYADGTERRFEVTGRRSYAKTALPAEQLFTRSGPPVLTLITCGGAFDRATRRYAENVVVFAVPVEAVPADR
jgi:hypothetical protein